jgi:hypothetical protein
VWSEIWAYVKAVGGHSTALVGGCATVVWIGVVERWAGNAFPWRVWAPILGLLVLVATFKAWRDERDEAGRLRASLEAKTVRIVGWFEAGYSLCRDHWINPDKDDPVERTRFRIGLVNKSGLRLEGVKVTVGRNSSKSSLFGTTLCSYPEEEREFALAARNDGEPSIFVNVVVANVIRFQVSSGDERTDEFWTRYEVGPHGKYGGVTVDREPMLEFTLSIESAVGTTDVPCVLWLDEHGHCQFALVSPAQ